MKKFLAMLLCIGCLCWMAGCDNTPAEANASMPPDALDVGNAASSNTLVYGRVTSIVGNEVTLELGKVAGGGPGGMGGSAPFAGEGGAGAPSGEEFAGRGERPPEMTDGESPSGMDGREFPADMEGVERPSGTGEERFPPDNAEGGAPSGDMPAPGEFGGSEAQDGGNTQPSGNRGANMELNYTGETATYLLPAGMQIGTGDFSSVTEGMVLRLTLNADGEITAVSIISR